MLANYLGADWPMLDVAIYASLAITVVSSLHYIGTRPHDQRG